MASISPQTAEFENLDTIVGSDIEPTLDTIALFDESNGDINGNIGVVPKSTTVSELGVALASDPTFQNAVGGVFDAGDVTYDNTTSGLTTTDTQGAIDELADREDHFHTNGTFKPVYNGTTNTKVNDPQIVIRERAQKADGSVIVTGNNIIIEDVAIVIDENITFTIGTDFATIEEAHDYLSHCIIADDALVTVDVPAGTYTLTRPMRGHRDGVNILWKGATKTQAVLTDFYEADGVTLKSKADIETVMRGHYGTIIERSGTAISLDDGDLFISNTLFVGNGSGSGILSSRGNYVIYNGCSFHGFNRGIYGDRGSNLTTSSGSVYSCNSDAGVIMANGSTSFTQESISIGNNIGYSSSSGSVINIQNSQSHSNAEEGLRADINATIVATNVGAEYNDVGVWVGRGSIIHLDSNIPQNVSNNITLDILASEKSLVTVSGLTLTPSGISPTLDVLGNGDALISDLSY